MAGKSSKLTLREWLAQHGRNEPVHYKEIAEALKRDPASVSASLSIEWKQAQEDNRPAYFIRAGPGLYQYNDLCEGAVDEELISEVSIRAADINRATRREMSHEISKLSLEGFNNLAKIVLRNVRARFEEIAEVHRNNEIVVLVTSWRDDGGRSPVVVYVRKCDFDERISADLIREIRGSLPKYQANQGVLITNGIVTHDGKQEALGFATHDLKVSVPPVHIMDNDIILNVLIESGTGVRAKSVEVLLLDDDFFKQLHHLIKKN
ncbi:MAG: restriction endonuclease [Candidatus Thorarchaeota archaeon]